jgi:transposase
LRAVFHRVRARRGYGKAIVAVAHKLVIAIHHMIRDRTPYKELGGDHFDKINPTKTTRRLVARLERVGTQVTLKPYQKMPNPDKYKG